jgi:hypothetical protein
MSDFPQKITMTFSLFGGCKSLVDAVGTEMHNAKVYLERFSLNRMNTVEVREWNQVCSV